ncbi:hypothetical protein AMBR_FBHANALA_00714 [Dolosigranulum pigrum]|jgi:hypothetical protein|nr:hypothetical protein AMBR_FBHANALA_00714 [Dolosigranulum pigrum]
MNSGVSAIDYGRFRCIFYWYRILRRKFAMKKKLIKFLSVGAIFVGLMTVGTQIVLAQTYSSNVTLPRNGWMHSTTRTATDTTATSRVTNHKYDVVTRVVNPSETVQTSNKVHSGGTVVTHSHYHGISGANIQLGLRSSWINQRTNNITFSWTP